MGQHQDNRTDGELASICPILLCFEVLGSLLLIKIHKREDKWEGHIMRVISVEREGLILARVPPQSRHKQVDLPLHLS